MYSLWAFLFLCFSEIAGQQCPCSFAPLEDDLFSGKYASARVMCIVESEQEIPSISAWYRSVKELIEQRKPFVDTGIQIVMVTSYEEGMNNYSTGVVCDAYLQIIPDDGLKEEERKQMRQRHYQSCPGKCLSVPYSEIPSSIVHHWLEIGKYQDWSSSKQKRVR